MADTIIRFQADSGLTLKFHFQSMGMHTGTFNGLGYDASENGTSGWYGFLVPETVAGKILWYAKSGTETVANGIIELADDTGTYFGFDPSSSAGFAVSGGGGGGITIPDVQTAMTNQGYTTARATKLDNLDASVSSRSTVAAIWDHLLTAVTTTGSIGRLIKDNLNVSVSSRHSSSDGSSQYTSLFNKILEVPSEVFFKPVSGFVTAGTIGKLFADTLDSPVSSRQAEVTASTRHSDLMGEHAQTQLDITNIPAGGGGGATAAEIWDYLASSANTSGSFGVIVKGNLDAAVSTRQTSTVALNQYNNLMGEHAQTQTDIAAIPGGGGGGTTAAAIWDHLTSAIVTTGSIGKLVKDNLDATVSSRESTTDAGGRETALLAQHTATQTDISNIDVAADVTSALISQGLSSARAAKLDNLDATVSSRQSESSASTRYGNLMGEHAATQADVLAIDVTMQVQTAMTSQGYTSVRGGNLDRLDVTVASREAKVDAAGREIALKAEHDATQLAISNLATPATIAGVVWSQLTSGFNTDGSVGKFLTTQLDAAITTRHSQLSANAMASTNTSEHSTTLSAVNAIGDVTIGPSDLANISEAVWKYTTTSATTTGSMGKMMVTNLDVAVSSRESEANAFSRDSGNANLHGNTISAIAGLNNLGSSDVTAALTSQGYTSGRAAKLDYLDAAISGLESDVSAASRMGTLIGKHGDTIAAIGALDFTNDAKDALTAHGYTLARASKLDKLDNLNVAPPTADAIRDAIWNVAIVNHQVADSMGAALLLAKDHAVIAATNTQA